MFDTTCIRIAFRRASLAAALLWSLVWMAPQPAQGQPAESRHVLLVGGLGGAPQYTERFASYLEETHSLLVERFGIPDDQVRVLGEQAIAEQPFVDDVSTSDAIRAAVAQLSQRVGPDDHVYIILFGHGSFDGTHAQINIPRRDLNEADFAAMVDELNAGRVVFINTTSASGPFAIALSGPDRIVITATATGTERDETTFPRYFVEALRASDADLDKNSGLSVRELFVYTTSQVVGSFEQAGQLATEHALIEDNGDGSPTRFDDLNDAQDGGLAARTYLQAPQAIASVDDAARPLFQEKELLEQSIGALKREKATMDEDIYYAELESLFIQLARLNERIESAQ
jgi:hypothetical protein